MQWIFKKNFFINPKLNFWNCYSVAKKTNYHLILPHYNRFFQFLYSINLKLGAGFFFFFLIENRWKKLNWIQCIVLNILQISIIMYIRACYFLVLNVLETIVIQFSKANRKKWYMKSWINLRTHTIPLRLKKILFAFGILCILLLPFFYSHITMLFVAEKRTMVK